MAQNDKEQSSKTDEIASTRVSDRLASAVDTLVSARDTVLETLKSNEPDGKSKQHSGTPRENAAPSDSDAKPAFPSWGRTALLICAAVFALFIAIEFIGTKYFEGHLLPNTYVNGQNVSYMTASEASDATSTDKWHYTISEGEDSWMLNADDVGLVATPVNFEQCLAEQNNAAWMLRMFGGEKRRTEIHQDASYNQSKLLSTIELLPFAQTMQRTAPSDAYPELAKDGKSYSIHAEEPGTQVDVAAVAKAVIAALDVYCASDGDQSEAVEQTRGIALAATDEEDAARAKLQEAVSNMSGEESAEDEPVDLEGFDIVEAGAYLRPAILSDNESLNAAVDQANKWLAAEITYDIDGVDSAEVVGANLLPKWVSVQRYDNEDGSTTFSAIYDSDAVQAWLREIGEKYDTEFCGKEVTLGNGEKRYIPGGGSYGWITNEEAEFELLTADISSGNVVHRKFAMKQEAKQLEKISDEQYVEVSIDEQHAWLWEGGQPVWDARVVTGTSWFPTIKGKFNIYAKQSPATLIGEDLDKDGEPDYVSDVNYWMPFQGGYGLHDAVNWRGDDPGDYGGDVHWDDGSHGCVNFTLTDAEYLYGKVEVGTLVYVH